MRRLVVATVLLGLLGLLGLLAVPSSGLATPRAERAQASWDQLGVPYLRLPDRAGYDDERVAVRFHDTTVPFKAFDDGINAIAATTDSAVVAAADPSEDEFNGPLFEIGADGTTGTVEKNALGIPLADPLGHHVFWTARRSAKARLMAYDTRTHTRIPGPVVRRSSVRVFAVVGESAYLVRLSRNGQTATAARWTVSSPEIEPLTLPTTGDDDVVVLVDVAGDRFLSTDFERTVLSDGAGNILARFRGALFATFSPDARYAASRGETRVRVKDLEGGGEVRLRGLGRRFGYDFQWSPTGVLVVKTVRRQDADNYDDATAVRRFACRLPSGRCAPLPGLSALFYEPILPASSLGQLFTTFSFGRATPKAPPAYLRHN